MVDDISKVIENSDVIVIGNKDESFRKWIDGISGDKDVVDFVRLDSSVMSSGSYHGICW
jgi:GDP-mannose 6-dehydrogenase